MEVDMYGKWMGEQQGQAEAELAAASEPDLKHDLPPASACMPA
jgi:hypothetical protein